MEKTNLITLEALVEEDQVNSPSRAVSDTVQYFCNSLLNMFGQSVSCTPLPAAVSWGGNIKAWSAGKINNPGGKERDCCLVEAGQPRGRSRWGESRVK